MSAELFLLMLMGKWAVDKDTWRLQDADMNVMHNPKLHTKGN